MKKQLLLSAVCMVLLTVCLSCEKSSKDSFLAVENTELKFSSNGSSQTLRVTSDGDWSIMDAPDWLEFSSTRGVNSQDVTVTARPNLTGVRREGAFVVRTNNGSQQQVVRVIQSGEGNVDKFNVPDVSKRWLNGDIMTTGGKDSVYIDANIPWTVEGPDWLQAYFEYKNFPINGQVEKQKSGYLVIMSRQSNDTDDDREGVLRISSPKSQKVFEVPVAQLGMGHLQPRDLLVMAHGFATSFKYGKGIERIRFKIFEGQAAESEVTTNEANKSWNSGDFASGTWVSYSYAKPNTQYELCVWTISDGHYDHLNRFTITTSTENNQPLAEFQNVRYNSGTLQYDIVKNSLANGFYALTITPTSSRYDYSDVRWAYFIRANLDSYKFRTENMIGISTSSENKLLTWAVGADGQFSTVLTSYKYATNSNARVFNLDNEQPLMECMQE